MYKVKERKSKTGKPGWGGGCGKEEENPQKRSGQV